MKIKRFGIVGLVSVGVLLLSHPSPVAAGVEKNYCSFSYGEYCSLDKPFSPNITFTKKQMPKSVLGASVQEKKTPTPLPSVEPTKISVVNEELLAAPTPTTTPEPTVVPEVPTPTSEPITQETAVGTLSSEVMFELINQHRTGKGLPAYQKDDRLCALAQSRIPQLQNEMYGSGFVHQGFNAMDLDYWVTENMVAKPSEQAGLGWWLGSGLHRRAIESSEHTHSCGACSGTVCIQLFSSFIPK